MRHQRKGPAEFAERDELRCLECYTIAGMEELDVLSMGADDCVTKIPARGAMKSSLAWMPDMTPRELATLAPLVVLTLFFGIYPAPILDTVAASIENLLKSVQVAATHIDTITLTMK